MIVNTWVIFVRLYQYSIQILIFELCLSESHITQSLISECWLMIEKLERL